ncbi:DUF4270 domain-containing protein [Pedobacter punctiformis]|uniref:DUF4270 domain-containing protein n=1 Tax=Pedobacter punctiformis TaxID=3004097 RepID=A0ABT4L6M0_9SPHI|nr:DUF4270 domain-containing protein [Pedobacter sp. HCMS5-2]MCZ4243476.1 DUF4270 domain-containing protein [Pedobacter sp. HCMS5-2]
MKFIKQDLLTLLIGLFLFASCKNPDGVGLDVDPNTAIVGTLVDNQEIVSQTVAEAAFNTGGLVRHPLGRMTDPVFGITESSLAMTIYPNQLSQDFGTAPVLDSAVLVLRIDTTNVNTKFYGDTSNSVYNIAIHQLTNKITDYKSSTTQAHNSQLLGTFNGKIYPNTPVKVYNVTSKKTDTLKAQIRIKLDKQFFQNNIVNLAATAMSTNAKFVDYFKGLSATATNTGTGGIAFINFASDKSYLQLVYRKTNTSNGTDTLNIKFPISNSTGIAANVKHDYTGTPVAAQLASATPSTFTTTYVQGLGGVKTKISFPNLVNFSSTYGKSIINRAELVVDLSTGTYAYPFNPAQRLALYRWDIAQQPVNVPDHDQSGSNYTGDSRAVTDGTFGGYYDSLKNRYVFIVTSYVQDLIDKKKEDYGTFLSVTPLTEFQLTPTGTSAERAIIGAKGNANNKVKLNIYYTKIN